MPLNSTKESFKDNVSELRKLYRSNENLKNMCKKKNKEFILSRKHGKILDVMNSKDKAFTDLYMEILKKAKKFRSDVMENVNKNGALPDNEVMYSQLNEDIKGLPEQFAEFIEKFKLYKYENYSANLIFMKLFDTLTGFEFSYL